MQAVAQDISAQEEPQTAQIAISVEFIAYAVLIALALVLRLAEIDTAALTGEEARQALASWRVIHPEMPGSPLVAESPLLFLFNNITFTLLGSSEFSARILTIMGGIGLALSPLLFRDLLGWTRTFLFCVMFNFSPVALLTSRFSSPVVWSLLFAVIAIYAVWRYWDTRRQNYGVLAIAMASATIFLAEPGGIVLVLILLGAGIIALWFSALDAPNQDDDMTGGELLTAVRGRLAAWPWSWGLTMALLLVVIVGTNFMLYPAGLSTLGELLTASLRNLTTPRPNTSFAFPLQISLFYETFLWSFAVAGGVLIFRRAAFNYVERFLLAWLVLGVIFSSLYVGSGSEHALWLTLPLAGLASYAATAAFVTDESTLLWSLSDEQFSHWQIPAWSKWLLAVLMVAILAFCAVHFQIAGRLLTTLPTDSPFNETISLIMETRYVPLRISLIWLILGVLFAVVGYLMAASTWGGVTTAQGGFLGLLIFGVVTSAGSGWNAAVSNASNARELWHAEPTSSEVFLLRRTMFDFAMRETGAFPDVPVTVVLDRGSGITDDGVLAWVLRDFPNTRYVLSNVEAKGGELVLMKAPPSEGALPDLGGAYVGQSFTIMHSWDASTARLIDLPGWWSHRHVRVPPYQALTLILWVRQDVYDGVSLSPNAAG